MQGKTGCLMGKMGLWAKRIYLGERKWFYGSPEKAIRPALGYDVVVCVSTCVFMCVCVVYECPWVCICICVYMFECQAVSMSIHMCLCMCLSVFLYICIWVSLYVCVCMHIYMCGTVSGCLYLLMCLLVCRCMGLSLYACVFLCVYLPWEWDKLPKSLYFFFLGPACHTQGLAHAKHVLSALKVSALILQVMRIQSSTTELCPQSWPKS